MIELEIINNTIITNKYNNLLKEIRVLIKINLITIIIYKVNITKILIKLKMY